MPVGYGYGYGCTVGSGVFSALRLADLSVLRSVASITAPVLSSALVVRPPPLSLAAWPSLRLHRAARPLALSGCAWRNHEPAGFVQPALFLSASSRARDRLTRRGQSGCNGPPVKMRAAIPFRAALFLRAVALRSRSAQSGTAQRWRRHRHHARIQRQRHRLDHSRWRKRRRHYPAFPGRDLQLLPNFHHAKRLRAIRRRGHIPGRHAADARPIPARS